jgi:TonB family protein
MRAIPGVVFVVLALTSGCGGGDASTPAPMAPPLPATTATAAAMATAPPAAAPASSNPDADAVEASRPALRACYDQARRADPTLARTTVTLSMRVDPSGQVTTVELEYKHRFDDASKQCMRDAALAMKLPTGEPRRVTVPVTFEPR